MSKPADGHLQLGAFVALAGLEDGDGSGPVNAHLTSCESCAARLHEVRGLVKCHECEALEKYSHVLGGQPCAPILQDPEKNIAILCAFLDDRLSKSAMTRFLHHLNHCYDCFEEFFVNWTDYLSAKS